VAPPITSRGASFKELARRLTRPITGPIDGRVADINRRVASSTRETRGALAETTEATRGALAALDRGLNQVVGAFAEAQLESTSFLGAQLRALEAAAQDLRADDEALRVSTDRVRDELRAVQSVIGELHAENKALRAELGALVFAPLERIRDRFVRLADGTTEDLDRPAADLLNYAASHRGFAAQEELWLNPPLVVEHGEREVRLSTVNERIVEIPFAMGAVSRLEAGARVLDFGSSESSLALSLASLGFAVTALDLRTYPFAHPRLEVIASPIEDWDAEPGSFDAALCVSTLEHVGLGWYGDPRHEAGGDRVALDRISELLKPGGLLVLTVPYGAPSVDALQRRYDRRALDALLEGWEILERRVVEQVDQLIWAPVEESSAVAVALVMARRPASA
jgi:2-polyprenyl-3-methyl-5-hydroxy-6-metoxy-1,4-benzoquinol methylase